MPTPRAQVSDDGFGPGVSKSVGAGAVEPSDLTTLKEAEAMLIDKEKRIDAMDVVQSAKEGRDIGALKARNQIQLAEVRKEIARLTKTK